MPVPVRAAGARLHHCPAYAKSCWGTPGARNAAQGWRTEPLRLFVTFGHGWSSVVTALVSPAMLLCLAAATPFAADSPRAQFLVAIGVVVFAAGALALAWPIVLGAYRARIRLSAVDLLLVGPYLVLVCAAAWAAVWELLVAPHHWNKTRHDRAAGGPVRTSLPAPERILPGRAGC